MNTNFTPLCSRLGAQGHKTLWQGAALAVLTASLAACGPSTPAPAGFADNSQTSSPAAPTTPLNVAPVQQPAEVSPPPTTTAPRPSVPSYPKPAPIQSQQPQPVVQAPQVIEVPRPVVAQRVERPAGQFGRVTSIQTLRSEAHSNGTGAVIGGVLGGVLGHQIGGGNGRTAATAIGAVGGAVAGNNVEKNRSRDVIGYRVSVHLDNGKSHTVTVNTLDGLSEGDRVRYADGRLFHA